jgi:hypothetical protein
MNPKRRRVTPEEYRRLKRERRDDNEAAIREWRRRFDELVAHRETEELPRNCHMEVWEYVEKMFPRISTTLAEVKIYRNTNTAFCRRVGFPPQAGGLFVRPVGAIAVFYNRKIPDDVVVLHELLHAAAQMLGPMRGSEFEEGFAYERSLPYLLERYDRDWVATNYLMPYYSTRVRDRDYGGRRPELRRDREELHRKAMEFCNSLIDSALQAPDDDDDEPGEGIGRFSLMI